jgi:hypothetical protein
MVTRKSVRTDLNLIVSANDLSRVTVRPNQTASDGRRCLNHSDDRSRLDRACVIYPLIPTEA